MKSMRPRRDFMKWKSKTKKTKLRILELALIKNVKTLMQTLKNVTSERSKSFKSSQKRDEINWLTKKVNSERKCVS